MLDAFRILMLVYLHDNAMLIVFPSMLYRQIPSAHPSPLFQLRLHKAIAWLAGCGLTFPPAALMPRLRHYLSSMLVAESLAPTPADVAFLMMKFSSLVTQLQAGGPIIQRKRNTIAMLFDIFAVQSEMSIDSPDDLVLGYTQLMMGFLIFQPAPGRIGMIGLGGGSLAKFCYRHLGASAIEIAEISPAVIALRDEFKIPSDGPRFKIRCQDGAVFMKETAQLFDVLLIDGFDKDGQPPQLCSRDFYDDCYRALSTGGIMVTNLLAGEEETEVHIEALRAAFRGQVYVIEAFDSLNKIAYACRGDLLQMDMQSMLRRTQQAPAMHPMMLRLVAHALLHERDGAMPAMTLADVAL